MLNDRHLHDFWVVIKEGGFARAAERLDMAVQTISAQVRELEKPLRHQLLKPAVRGVALTEAARGKVARLAVGLSDGISKLVVHALLEPVLATPNLRLASERAGRPGRARALSTVAERPAGAAAHRARRLAHDAGPLA